MTKISGQYALLAVAVLCLAVSVALPVFVYRELDRALVYVARVHGDLLSEGQKETKERAAHQLVIKTADTRDRVTRMTVAKGDAAGFIGEVESSAKEAGASLDIGQVTLGQAAAGLNSLSLQVTAEGGRSSVMNFLKLLETLPYATFVPTASLEKREKTWVLRATVETLIQL